MALDGRLLARARDALENIREKNRQEFQRRRRAVLREAPEYAGLEQRLRACMAEAVAASLGEKARDIETVSADSLQTQCEMAELLTRIGKPVDYLDELYDCPKCRDTGFINGRICACLRALYHAEATRELSALFGLGDQRFEQFNLSFYDDLPDPKTGLSPRKRMERSFEATRSYAHNFGPGAQNLLFQGATGLGKTFLSACIARVVSEAGFSVVYDTAVSALEAFEIQKFSRDSDAACEAAEKIRRMLGCDLMILDDLGTEMVTAFSVSALYTLINTRLSAGKKTIISTNLSAEEIRRAYSPQIASRLEGEFLTIPFAGRDIRQVKKERQLL